LRFPANSRPAQTNATGLASSCPEGLACHRTASNDPPLPRRLMAHQPTVFRGPDTEEAFFADKMRFWGGVNKAIVGTVIFMVVLLVGMAVFLL